MPAKIVIDENSGIIVMGKDVRVSTVAVAQSNLTVTIAESPEIVAAQSAQRWRHRGRAAHRPQVSTSDSNLALVRESVTLQQLVDGLNALGISPARPHRHPPGDQGRGRAPGRDRGAVMARSRLDLRADVHSPRPIGKLRAAGRGTRRRVPQHADEGRCSPRSTPRRQSSAAASPKKPGARCSPSNSPSAMAETGGIGLADQLVSELMQLQEATSKEHHRCLLPNDWPRSTIAGRRCCATRPRQRSRPCAAR